MNWPRLFPRTEREKSKSELLYEQYEFEKRERAKMADKISGMVTQNVIKPHYTAGINFQDIVNALNQEEIPHAVTELPLDIDSAISGAAPQIIKPISVPTKPEPTPVEPQLDSHDDISLYPKTVDKWQKIVDELEDHYTKTGHYKNIVEEDDDGNWVPCSISSSSSHWAGTFQPSLKPSNNPTPITPKFSTWVSIGSPKKSGIRLNCIENSRGEFIYFKDNRDIVKQAIEDFNRDYAEESRMKTVLAGENNTEYVNFSLTFDSLSYEDVSIVVNFEKYEFVAGNGSGITSKLINAIDVIRNSCQFYLQGEIDLDEETESKIVSMKISGINYINPKRMKAGEQFVYL